MEAKAIHKGAQIAPLKAKMTIDLIRGKKVGEAENVLSNTNTKASRLILKVLISAYSNAVNNLGLDKDNLYVKECYISEGRTLKRYKKTTKGKIDKRYKRTSHIYVTVAEIKATKED